MCEDLRIRLKKPLGRLLPARTLTRDLIHEVLANASLKVAIGDSTTDFLIKMGVVPDVHVVDGREKRRSRTLPNMVYTRQLNASNPAGSLSEEALKAISEALSTKGPVRVLINGEEDLLTLPAIALSPDGTVVLYGQPDEGLVAVWVKEDSRTMALSILDGMGIPRALLNCESEGEKG